MERLNNQLFLVAATDLTQLNGRLFDDVFGNGFDVGEQVANASLQLYRYDGSGPTDPGGGDDLVTSDATDRNGTYRFDSLSVVRTFFQVHLAQNVSGYTLLRAESALVNIDANNVTGRIVTTIDDFASIGEIEMKITGTADVNESAELAGTVGPPLFIEEFDNIDLTDLSQSL